MIVHGNSNAGPLGFVGYMRIAHETAQLRMDYF